MGEDPNADIESGMELMAQANERLLLSIERQREKIQKDWLQDRYRAGLSGIGSYDWHVFMRSLSSILPSA